MRDVLLKRTSARILHGEKIASEAVNIRKQSVADAIGQLQIFFLFYRSGDVFKVLKQAPFELCKPSVRYFVILQPEKHLTVVKYLKKPSDSLGGAGEQTKAFGGLIPFKGIGDPLEPCGEIYEIDLSFAEGFIHKLPNGACGKIDLASSRKSGKGFLVEFCAVHRNCTNNSSLRSGMLPHESEYIISTGEIFRYVEIFSVYEDYHVSASLSSIYGF